MKHHEFQDEVDKRNTYGDNQQVTREKSEAAEGATSSGGFLSKFSLKRLGFFKKDRRLMADRELAERVEMANSLKKSIIKREFQKEYSRGLISLMFMIIFVSNIFINVDHGSLAGCSVELKQDLKMNDVQYGILGSIAYCGILIGSMVATGVFNTERWIKCILLVSLFFNAIMIYLFTQSDQYYVEVLIRFCIGFFQIFVCIYQPVWGDTFAEENQKQVWLSIQMLAAPIGSVGGFVLTSVMTQIANWRYSFYIQGSCIAPCVVFILLVPKKYFNIESTLAYKAQCQKECVELLKKSIDEHDQVDDSAEYAHLFENSIIPMTSENLLMLKKSTRNLIRKDILYAEAKIENPNFNQTENKFDTMSFKQSVASIMTNKVFLCMCFGLSGIYYFLTGIQYWFPDYLKTQIGLSQHEVTAYCATIFFFGPISGAIFGGFAIYNLGGYNTIASKNVLSLAGTFGCLCILPVPFLKDIKSIGALMFSFLFFGGFLPAPCTGLMINSVADSHRTSANSIANMSYNIFGYIPGPFIYGLLSSIYNQHVSMIALMYSTIITIFLLIYGMHLNYKVQQQVMLNSKHDQLF